MPPRPAREVVGGEWSLERPAQSRSVGDDFVYVFDGGIAFCNQVDRFAEERGGQPVGEVTDCFLLEEDRRLADCAVEVDRPFQRLA